MMFPLAYAVTSLLLVIIYTKLRYKRFKEYSGLPQFPPSLIWGNLETLYEFSRLRGFDQHPDHILHEILKAAGWPQLFLLDVWPLRSPLLLVASHEVSEQLSKPTEIFPFGSPKSPSMTIELGRLIGAKSVLTTSGEEWRTIRKRYNPAFSHQQLLGYIPSISEKTQIYLENLDILSNSGKEFELLRLCLNLSLDVIGKVVLGLDLNAQHSIPNQLIQDYLKLQGTYNGLLAVIPGWVVPLIDLKRQRLEKSVNKAIEKHIQHVFNNMQENYSDIDDQDSHKSVLSQVLQHIDSLTPEILSETRDQLKSFLLAGRDTTGTAIAWAIYELSLTPHALKEVRGEVNAILGQQTDTTSIYSKIISARIADKDMLGRMPYTQAVVKETLRLHPPVGAMRYIKRGTGLTVHDSSTGKTHCLDGLAVYLCMPAIHRNPNVYGETADAFCPERWLDSTESAKVPTTAWRPFERGPRGCIGQELAMTEICLVLALVAQRYDFRKRGLGEATVNTKGEPIVDSKTRQHKVIDELYNVLQLVPKPVDGMRMEVEFAKSVSEEESTVSAT
ncbi:cytochrome P450 [Xylaria cubensis]|nr:cytochrome P450 [Xylaria cubensis]